jgi:phosphatidylglycerol:prolipoprotein diacylglycerol transferase
MHPILFKIGPLEIPTYGVILVSAFLIANFLIKKEAGALHLPVQKTQDMALTVLLMGLVGSKTLLILIDLPYYIKNPGQLIHTLRSAGVLYGGVILGLLTAIYLIRKHQFPIWNTLDLFAPLMAMGIGIGRLGCFFAGCCYGIEYHGPLSVVFPSNPYCEAPAGVSLFPVQLLAVLNGLLLFALLLWMLKHRKFRGQIAGSFLFLYALARFLLEFLRGDAVRGIWLGGLMSTSQIIALAMMAGAVVLLIKCYKLELK